MSNRLSTWSSYDASNWLNYYWDEAFYGELIPMSGWEVGNGPVAYESAAFFTLGGWDPYGRDDSFDIATIYLQGGETYEIYLAGEFDYLIETDMSLLILDDWGYVLEAYYFPPDAVFDASISFTSSYDGWYHISAGSDSLDYFTAFLYVAELNSFDPIPDLHPYIRNKDEYNWDNDIDTGDGWLYIAAEDAQLYRAYMGAMGRIPDAGGFNWWANEIEWGREDLFSMADGFINSTEFKGYADTNYDGKISNDEFITHMYEGVFGRTADVGGYNYWLSELSTGASDQGEVLIYMTQSNEYVDQTLEAVADYLFT